MLYDLDVHDQSGYKVAALAIMLKIYTLILILINAVAGLISKDTSHQGCRKVSWLALLWQPIQKFGSHFLALEKF